MYRRIVRTYADRARANYHQRKAIEFVNKIAGGENDVPYGLIEEAKAIVAILDPKTPETKAPPVE